MPTAFHNYLLFCHFSTGQSFGQSIRGSALHCLVFLAGKDCSCYPRLKKYQILNNILEMIYSYFKRKTHNFSEYDGKEAIMRWQ